MLKLHWLRPHRTLTLALGAAAVAFSAPAAAHGGGRAAPATVADLPPSKIKTQLEEVVARADKAGQQGAIKKPVKESLRAIERSRGAAVAGDRLHASQLRELAGRWSRVAAVLVKAAVAEKAADAQQKKAQELNTKLERAELLLAEQQSRLARLKAAVKAAEARLQKRREANAAAEAARVAGDKKKPTRKRR